MDLRLLRSFVTIAEEGNVGRAAQRLYISQPALSKQLQRRSRSGHHAPHRQLLGHSPTAAHTSTSDSDLSADDFRHPNPEDVCTKPKMATSLVQKSSDIHTRNLDRHQELLAHRHQRAENGGQPPGLRPSVVAVCSGHRVDEV